jgi:hypothetical protein
LRVSFHAAVVLSFAPGASQQGASSARASASLKLPPVI